jgi:hypothetical protein
MLMPDPLASDVVARLRTDPTAALAAALILAGSFPDLVQWALRAFGGQARCAGKANGESTRATKASHANPREAAKGHDQALLELMRVNPGASLAEIIRLNGRPRNSTALSLERLEEAGLVEHAGRGKWSVVDPDLLEAPAPKPAGWLAPLSGAHVAKHAADGRVRGELAAP